MKTVLPLALLLLGLAACAPATPHWAKPGVGDDAVASDWSQCKELSDEEAPPPPAPPGSNMGGMTASDPFGPLDQEKAATQSRQIVSDCMTAKGYHPTEP